MDRTFESGAAGSPPSAPASPSIGYPTAGNPGSTPATKPGPWWYHMITEEIRKVVLDAGLTPDHTDLAQLSQAVQTLVSNLAAVAASTGEISGFSAVNKFIRPDRIESAFARSLTANGYQKLPGGLIIQWGSGNMSSGNSQVITYPIAFPTAALMGLISDGTGSSSVFVMGVQTPGLSTMTAWCSSAAPGGYYWLAIGY